MYDSRMKPHECFACGKPLTTLDPKLVDTRDDQTVFIGPECFKHVKAAGEEGYQPPRGGPRLFPISKDIPIRMKYESRLYGSTWDCRVCGEEYEHEKNFCSECGQAFFPNRVWLPRRERAE